MEKKGDLLNQFAIISDLVEKVNMDFENSTMVFELSNNEFERTYDYISTKQKKRKQKSLNTFMVKMGNIDIIFNRSNDEKVQFS